MGVSSYPMRFDKDYKQRLAEAQLYYKEKLIQEGRVEKLSRMHETNFKKLFSDLTASR